MFATSQVSASTDDAEEDLSDGSMDITSSDLEMCVEDNIWPLPDDNQLVGIRFASVQVPQGAIIDSAVIRFTVDEANNNPATLMIYGEKGNNAQTFYSLPNNISARERTSAVVSWYVPSWGNAGASGAHQDSPNLKEIVQEIVDRPGWISGNSMVFIVEGTGTRNAQAYDGNSGGAPSLVVFWSNVARTSEFEQINVKLYPNPASSEIHVELNEGEFDAELLDVTGQRMAQYARQKGNLNIDLTDVPSGLYLLRVSNSFQTTTKRIIKR